MNYKSIEIVEYDKGYRFHPMITPENSPLSAGEIHCETIDEVLQRVRDYLLGGDFPFRRRFSFTLTPPDARE